MGVTDALARAAARRAHVLLVEVPGHWSARAAVEAELVRRAWLPALNPADADVLVECGRPDPALVEPVELVWSQMPGPRVRVRVAAPDEAAARLDAAHAALLDTAAHRGDAADRVTGPELVQGRQDGDHSDMEMAPGGIPLAEGGEDRDGLEMDVLHVHLGPVLAHWPPGLSLRCTLQGDVITHAEAVMLGSEAETSPSPTASARHLDHLVTFLAVAGQDDGAAEARAIRDALLQGVPDADVTPRWGRLRRRVRRSLLLRWGLRGLRVLEVQDLRERGWPHALAGDTHDRLLRLVDLVDRSLDGDQDPPPGVLPVEALPLLVTGLDLAAARLVVASVGGLELRIVATEVPDG